jgi:hypothetical protein
VEPARVEKKDDIPMKKYESLTKYLPMMQQDTFEEWHIDQKNDGTMEHPYEMPYVEYSKLVRNFEKDVYAFAEDHPDCGLNKYGEILERNGIKWGSKSMRQPKRMNLMHRQSWL